MEYLNPLCPNCGEELTLYRLPDIDCTEDTVWVKTKYECEKCGRTYTFRAEGKVSEWSEPNVEED